MFITEQDKINHIIEEGAKDKISLIDFIKIQIKEFDESDQYKEMIIGSKYAQNENDIKNKNRYFTNSKGQKRLAKGVANNKLEHSFLRKMKLQKQGYLLRKKMTIKEVGEDKEEDTVFIDFVKDFFNNRRHKMLKRTLGEDIDKGISWWQIYIDDQGELKAKLRYGTEMIPEWSDREHETLASMTIRYPVTVYDKSGKKIIYKVEYWNLDGVRYLVEDGSNLIQDVEMIDEDRATNIDEDSITICSHFLLDGIEKQKCTWEKLPFIYWKYNDDERPLIHYLKSLVDAYDKLTSDMADMIEDTPNAVKVVKNYAAEIETFCENLNTYGYVPIAGDGDFKFESPQINTEAFKMFIEQLRKDIHEAGFAVDTQNDKFGNQPSGVAIQQLYEDLDLDCSNIETEYKSSLEYLLFFIKTYLLLTTGKDYFDKDIEFIFNKSMIINETERIQDCKNSEGQISQKTILSKHPYVTDVEEEIKQLEDERRQEIDQYSNVIPSQEDGDTDEK